MKYMVKFGFEVEAQNSEEARIKAKKNLKERKIKYIIAEYNCERTGL